MLIYNNGIEVIPWVGQTIDGVNHPLNIEQLWSPQELSSIGLYVVEPFTVPAGKQIVSGPTYTIADGVGRRVYVLADIESAPETFEDRKEALIAGVGAKAREMFASGAPIAAGGETLHIRLDDGSRADLSAMGATAIAAAAGSILWPESYSLGWITVENKRIPLPTPASGLALAVAAGGWYARIVQNGRDLKDAIAAAADDAELAAIDIEVGWP